MRIRSPAPVYRSNIVWWIHSFSKDNIRYAFKALEFLRRKWFNLKKSFGHRTFTCAGPAVWNYLHITLLFLFFLFLSSSSYAFLLLMFFFLLLCWGDRDLFERSFRGYRSWIVRVYYDVDRNYWRKLWDECGGWSCLWNIFNGGVEGTCCMNLLA